MFTRQEIESMEWDLIGDVYHNLGTDIDDDRSFDEATKQISKMTPEQIVSRWLAWNGVLGYGEDVYKLCISLYETLQQREEADVN
jgi:hypothetical protein